MDKGPFPTTSTNCQSKLKNPHMPKFDHDRGLPYFDLSLMDDVKYNKAKQLAISWHATAAGDMNIRPYTNIHKLLDFIIRGALESKKERKLL